REIHERVQRTPAGAFDELGPAVDHKRPVLEISFGAAGQSSHLDRADAKGELLRITDAAVGREERQFQTVEVLLADIVRPPESGLGDGEAEVQGPAGLGGANLVAEPKRGRLEVIRLQGADELAGAGLPS